MVNLAHLKATLEARGIDVEYGLSGMLVIHREDGSEFHVSKALRGDSYSVHTSSCATEEDVLSLIFGETNSHFLQTIL